MTASTMLDPRQIENALATLCPACQEPVLRVLASSGRLVRVQPTPTVGGLYELVSAGGTIKASRRNLFRMYEEHRAGTAFHGGGYEPHRCDTATE